MRPISDTTTICDLVELTYALCRHAHREEEARTNLCEREVGKEWRSEHTDTSGRYPWKPKDCVSPCHMPDDFGERHTGTEWACNGIALFADRVGTVSSSLGLGMNTQPSQALDEQLERLLFLPTHSNINVQLPMYNANETLSFIVLNALSRISSFEQLDRLPIPVRAGIRAINTLAGILSVAIRTTERAVADHFVKHDPIRRYEHIVRACHLLENQCVPGDERVKSGLARLKSELRDDQLFSTLLTMRDMGQLRSGADSSAVVASRGIKFAIGLACKNAAPDSDVAILHTRFAATRNYATIVIKRLIALAKRLFRIGVVELELQSRGASGHSLVLDLPADLLSLVCDMCSRADSLSLMETCTRFQTEPLLLARKLSLRMVQPHLLEQCAARIPGLKAGTSSSTATAYKFPHQHAPSTGDGIVVLRRTVHLAVGFSCDAWEETAEQASRLEDVTQHLLPFVTPPPRSVVADPNLCFALCTLVDADTLQPVENAYLKAAPWPDTRPRGPQAQRTPTGSGGGWRWLPDDVDEGSTFRKQVNAASSVVLARRRGKLYESTSRTFSNYMAPHHARRHVPIQYWPAETLLFGASFSVHSPSSTKTPGSGKFRFQIRLYFYHQASGEYVTARNLVTRTTPFSTVAHAMPGWASAVGFSNAGPAPSVRRAQRRLIDTDRVIAALLRNDRLGYLSRTREQQLDLRHESNENGVSASPGST